MHLFLFIDQAIANNPAVEIIQCPSVFCSLNRGPDLRLDELEMLKVIDLDVPSGISNQTPEKNRIISEADSDASSST